MPISPIDAITPAFHHTVQQLLKPFRIAQWAKLALVGFLAGEMSSGGGCSSPNLHLPAHSGGPQHFFSLGLPGQNPLLYPGLIAVLVVAGLVLGVLFLYVSSVMRFVLFDSIIAKRCDIARGWSSRQVHGLRYFIWKLLFSLATIATLVILIGVPATLAFAAGWLKHAREHIIALILGGIVLFFVLLLWFVLSLAIQVLTKDFVVPQMALEDLGPIQAWRRLLPMIQAEKGGYAGYLGIKVVMTIGTAIILAIISMIVILVMLIPAGGIGVIAVLLGKTAGLTWNLYTISVTVIVAIVAVAAILYLVALISVPATVFFPAYSIYFFGSRYPRLGQLLYPPAAPAAAIAPPTEAPPFITPA